MYKNVTINIMVKNVKETIEFYESKLGFKSVLTVPESGDVFDFAVISKDDISIMLQEQKSLLGEYPTLKSDDIIPTFTLFIRVDDVMKLYEEVKDKVEIAVEPHKPFYGDAEFAMFDNNGNILTIA